MTSRLRLAALAVLSTAAIACSSAPPMTPEERLASRLEWFQDQKLGFMVHWGVYSQWGCIESWPLVEVDTWARPDDLPAWTGRGKDIERFKKDYWALNRTFDPKQFDPAAWVAAAKDAGMKYFTFTTKHHDGFSMFDTKFTDFRSTHPDCPFSRNPRADAVQQLFTAFRDAGFGIGAYFSKADWHHPDYWSPGAPAKDRNPNYDTRKDPAKWGRFVTFVHNQIEELMTRYGRVDILWLDAGQVRPPTQDIQMDRLVAMARSHQPDLIVADRTVHGPHENYLTPEQEVPPKPLPKPWESCITLGKQWSYKPDDTYKSVRELVQLIVDVVAKGGNLILNAGPTPDGEIPPPALERMRGIGAWLRVNGEAIYGTRAVAPYKEGRVCLTKKGGVIYAIHLAEDGKDAPPARIELKSVRPKAGSTVRLLGFDGAVPWKAEGPGVVLEVPAAAIRKPPCKDAFAFRIEVE